MGLPEAVKLVEVGPRDGLQNEPTKVPTAIRVALIEKLANCGLQSIEAGAFVSPKWVPQMADSGEVFAALSKKAGVVYSALIPNLKGLEAALQAGVDEVAVFAAASESFSHKNINCSIEESLARFLPVFQVARDAQVRVRGYVSCVLGCPYEGAVDPQAVADVSAKLMDMGCYEVSLGDTIGRGTPNTAEIAIERVARAISIDKVAVHFHDTFGQALANLYAALQMGVRVIDSSVAGLGGCPYAKGASGNVATEDVLYMLNGLGIETGVDMMGLLEASAFISKELSRPSSSKVAQAFLGSMDKSK